MTDTGSRRHDTRPTSAGHPPTVTERTGWTGWIYFASSMMFLLGALALLQGLVGIFDQGYYAVTERGLVVNVDYTVWGWVHLLLGVLILASAGGVLSGNLAARTVGVVLALLSTVVNMVFLAATPIWSTIVIAIDVLVIYALTAHGGEMRDAR
jgi:hypothetical protein